MPTWRELGPRSLREAGIPRRRTGADAPHHDRPRGNSYLREVCGLPWSEQEIMDKIIARMEDFYSMAVRPKPTGKFLSILKNGRRVDVRGHRHPPPPDGKALKNGGHRPLFPGHHPPPTPEATSRKAPKSTRWPCGGFQSNKRDTVVFLSALYAARTAKAAGFRVAGAYDVTAEKGSGGASAHLRLLHPLL